MSNEGRQQWEKVMPWFDKEKPVKKRIRDGFMYEIKQDTPSNIKKLYKIMTKHYIIGEKTRELQYYLLEIERRVNTKKQIEEDFIKESLNKMKELELLRPKQLLLLKNFYKDSWKIIDEYLYNKYV